MEVRGRSVEQSTNTEPMTKSGWANTRPDRLAEALEVIRGVPDAHDSISQTTIEAEEVWDQSIWRTIEPVYIPEASSETKHRCGTAMCVAGWLVYLDPGSHYLLSVDFANSLKEEEWQRLTALGLDASVTRQPLSDSETPRVKTFLDESVLAPYAYLRPRLLEDLARRAGISVDQAEMLVVDSVQSQALRLLGLRRDVLGLFAGGTSLEDLERGLEQMRAWQAEAKH